MKKSKSRIKAYAPDELTKWTGGTGMHNSNDETTPAEYPLEETEVVMCGLGVLPLTYFDDLYSAFADQDEPYDDFCRDFQKDCTVISLAYLDVDGERILEYLVTTHNGTDWNDFIHERFNLGGENSFLELDQTETDTFATLPDIYPSVECINQIEFVMLNGDIPVEDLADLEDMRDLFLEAMSLFVMYLKDILKEHNMEAEDRCFPPLWKNMGMSEF